MFCHNDLLNANFLVEDGQIRILDWEYAGMGDRYFDLANLSANHGLDADEERVLLRAYFGAAGPAHLARLGLMRFMSDFREAMWAVVQQGISAIDFDFHDYAARHFAKLLAQRADPRFERWLHAVALEDPAAPRACSHPRGAVEHTMATHADAHGAREG